MSLENFALNSMMNVTMTVKECSDAYKSDLISVGILAIVGILIFAVLLVIMSNKVFRFIKFFESNPNYLKEYNDFTELHKGLY